MIKAVLVLGTLWFAMTAASAQTGGPGAAVGATTKPAVRKTKAHQPKPPPVTSDHNSDPTIKPAVAPR